jgi:hypothetical protein
VRFPAKFEMVVNLKTAKALGLAVPSSIMLSATEVVEQRRLFGALPLRDQEDFALGGPAVVHRPPGARAFLI